MTRLRQIFAWIRRHPIWSALIALVTLLVGYTVLVPSAPDYAYISAPVDRGEVVSKITASGKLRALNTIKVGAEVSGQITDVYVDFNSTVRAGQVLARIDPTRFRARVEQAQAQVALARANLLQVQAGAERSRTDLIVQARDFERKKALTAKGFLSEAGQDNASSAMAQARAANASSQAQIASSRAQIAQAQAELQTAMLDLNRTTIIAPTGGVIINKLVEPGTTVAASFQTPNLFEIAADTTRMQVEASVDEADIGAVREGQGVRFAVDAYPETRFVASVRQIRKAATETQNVITYLVILDVANPDGKLLPGMTANVEIITGRKVDVLRVPSGALRFRPKAQDRPVGPPDSDQPAAPKRKGPHVWMATADAYRPARRAVVTGLVGEDFVEITGGLKQGEKLLLRSKSLKPSATSPDSADEADDDDGAA